MSAVTALLIGLAAGSAIAFAVAGAFALFTAMIDHDAERRRRDAEFERELGRARWCRCE